MWNGLVNKKSLYIIITQWNNFVNFAVIFIAKIIVSKEESPSQWQQGDYKCFSPNTDWDTVDFSKAPAIQEMPVVSAICKPEQSEIIKVIDGKINVKGETNSKISFSVLTM